MTDRKRLKRLAVFFTVWICVFSIYTGVGSAAGEVWDIQVDKRLNTVGTIFSGDTVEYEIQIQNVTMSGGGYLATWVTITDTLDTNMTFTGNWSDSPDFTVNLISAVGVSPIVWEIPSLFQWDDITITYTVQVVWSWTYTNFVNVAPLAWAPDETSTTNNNDLQDITVVESVTNGQCGPDNGSGFYLPDQPGDDLCTAGLSTIPSYTASSWWTWDCVSSNGGTTDACSATELFCGDNLTQTGAGETCDDGNTMTWDGCNATCQIEWCTDPSAYNYNPLAVDDDGSCRLCGDGSIDTWDAEVCDDGNTIAWDWCNATCTLVETGYTCDTPWVACNDIDECGLWTDTCSDDAVCTNTTWSFACACNSGFTWDGFTCSDVDECTLWTDTCSDDAMCTNTTWSFACSCNSGFTWDGITCTDVNECTLWTDNCLASASCTNTTWSFMCMCASGFTWDGVTSCTDLDECSLWTDNCSSDAMCTNTTWSFACGCNSGYTWDGVTCTDVDECTLWTDTCSDNAACTNTTWSFSCGCNSWFTGDGFTCTDIDECTLWTDTCSADGTCTNTTWSFACSCNSWFSGDGITCSSVCGDSIVVAAEQCDDGWNLTGDGCDESCLFETPSCNLDVTPMTGLAPLLVTWTATYDSWSSILSLDWNDGSIALPSLPQWHTYTATWNYIVTLTVQSTITWSTLTWVCMDSVQVSVDCGNSIIEVGEVCDDGVNNGVVCSAPYSWTCQYCSSMCQTITVTWSFCGDGLIDLWSGEVCDDGVNNWIACTPAYGSTCDYCSNSCGTLTLTWSFCGDGVVDTWNGETCDDGNTIAGDGCDASCLTEVSSGWGWWWGGGWWWGWWGWNRSSASSSIVFTTASVEDEDAYDGELQTIIDNILNKIRMEAGDELVVEDNSDDELVSESVSSSTDNEERKATIPGLIEYLRFRNKSIIELTASLEQWDETLESELAILSALLWVSWLQRELTGASKVDLRRTLEQYNSSK